MFNKHARKINSQALFESGMSFAVQDAVTGERQFTLRVHHGQIEVGGYTETPLSQELLTMFRSKLERKGEVGFRHFMLGDQLLLVGLSATLLAEGGNAG